MATTLNKVAAFAELKEVLNKLRSQLARRRGQVLYIHVSEMSPYGRDSRGYTKWDGRRRSLVEFMAEERAQDRREPIYTLCVTHPAVLASEDQRADITHLTAAFS